MTIQTFPATAAHIPELIEINNRNYEFDKWDAQRFEQIMQNNIPIIILAKDGKIIGFLVYLLCLDEARILNLVIDNVWRGNGYGKILLSRVIEEVRYDEVRYIMLDVRVSNTYAINFYQNYGFEILCRRSNFYNTYEPKEDGYFMQLELVEETQILNMSLSGNIASNVEGLKQQQECISAVDITYNASLHS